MIEYLWRKRVYCDGRHNAWPDIAYFKGKYFISFSNQDAHFYRKKAKGLITSSEEGIDWSEPIQLTYKNWPICDASSLFVFKDRLYAEMWALPPSDKERVTLVTTTGDGKSWSNPTPIDPQISVWKVKEYKGVLYRVSREISASAKIYLWKSEDGLHWEKVSLVHKELFSSETAIHFLEDGRILGVARSESGPSISFRSASFIFLADPPYRQWKIINMNMKIDAPVICQVGDVILLAGRDVRCSCERVYANSSSLWSWDGDGFNKEVDLLFGLDKLTGWEKRPIRTHWENFPEAFIRILDGSYLGIQPMPDRKGEALICDYWGTASEADIWVTAIRAK